MSAKKQQGKAPTPQPAASRELADLAQIKALTHPLRLRIVELLCEGERTTKQVADALGEKPTKLYHHVDVLEKAGLIRMTRTRQNRGTVERYYEAVARSFTASATLFQPESPGALPSSELAEMLQGLMTRTGQEVRGLLSRPAVEDVVQAEGVLSFLEIQGSEAELLGIRDRLQALLEELGDLATRNLDSDADAAGIPDADQAAEGASEPAAPQRRFRLTVAFYPLDR